MNFETEIPCQIETALGVRKANGGLGTVLKEPEARRKKIKIPKPLNLKPANAKEVLLTFTHLDTLEESMPPA